MDTLVFHCIWGDHAAPEIAMVQDLWRTYRAVEREEVIAHRSKQIVYVVKNKDGAVGGVSTVRPVQVRFLNDHFFYDFRCFIAPDFRAPGLDSLLALKTKQFLETLPNPESKFKGLMMVVENQELKKQRTKAIWPASGMVFAGYNSKGHHIRIGYFKGARI